MGGADNLILILTQLLELKSVSEFVSLCEIISQPLIGRILAMLLRAT